MCSTVGSAKGMGEKWSPWQMDFYGWQGSDKDGKSSAALSMTDGP